MNKYTLSSLVATAAMALPCSGASIIAINFLRDATTTPAANDGSEFGIDTWEDVLGGDGSATVDGVTVSWDTTGGWSGGSPNNIENGYLDNAGAITISDLSAWLTANNASGYTIQTIGASDTSNNWFGDTLLRENDASGALLDTLTNPNLRNGPSTISDELTADILFVDPTTGGTAPAGGGGARTSVAGMIISANVIPEPSSTALVVFASLGLMLRRRR